MSIVIAEVQYCLYVQLKIKVSHALSKN